MLWNLSKILWHCNFSTSIHDLQFSVVFLFVLFCFVLSKSTFFEEKKSFSFLFFFVLFKFENKIFVTCWKILTHTNVMFRTDISVIRHTTSDIQHNFSVKIQANCVTWCWDSPPVFVFIGNNETWSKHCEVSQTLSLVGSKL